MKKWFRVATEGVTTDGRAISRSWIEQMAKNFNPETYGARVWMEHMRGIFADGPFRALGDVLAVKAEENSEGNLALYAQVDPTDDLIKMAKDRQKVYTSIEVDPEFADTGEAYLIGLAVTDSPASLGTEMLQFSSQAKNNPLNDRKQRPGNLFTAALETELDFSAQSDEGGTGDNEPDGKLFDRIKALFTKHRKTDASQFSEFRTDLEQTLELFVTDAQSLRTDLESNQAEFSKLKTAHDKLQADFAALQTQLETTPTTPSHRSPATGEHGAHQTDC